MSLFRRNTAWRCHLQDRALGHVFTKKFFKKNAATDAASGGPDRDEIYLKVYQKSHHSMGNSERVQVAGAPGCFTPVLQVFHCPESTSPCTPNKAHVRLLTANRYYTRHHCLGVRGAGARPDCDFEKRETVRSITDFFPLIIAVF